MDIVMCGTLNSERCNFCCKGGPCVAVNDEYNVCILCVRDMALLLGATVCDCKPYHGGQCVSNSSTRGYERELITGE
jgi:hypothetical protein